MKEKLYTMELLDAVKADDECMFCWLERKLEQESLEFVLGSSYMESDIREQTSRQGFCRHHAKMMYDYGNTLGNAWILKSRLEQVRKELSGSATQMVGKAGGIKAGKFPMGLFQKPLQKSKTSSDSCYLCERMGHVYQRMLDTFVYLLQDNKDFPELLLKSKGFCMPHYQDIVRTCQEKMSEKEQEIWLPQIKQWMEHNLNRVQEDVDWLIEKYDYRNKDADWKQSKDAVPRTMQKLTGGYPADLPFQCKK